MLYKISISNLELENKFFVKIKLLTFDLFSC